MTIFRFSVLGLLAMGLISCSPKISDEALICDQSPGFVADAETAVEQISVANQCIHKWGYRLGRAPGTNTEIASAVIAKCRLAVDWLHTLDSREGKSGAQKLFPTDSDWLAQKASFEQEALLRVVQGRAGSCPIRGIDQK